MEAETLAGLESSAALVAKLQYADLQELRDSPFNETRGIDISDFEMAVQLYEAELATWETTLSDQSFARSMARAVLEDTRVLQDMIVEEEEAARDRRMACEMSGVAVTNQAVVLRSPEEPPAEKNLARYASFNVPEIELPEYLDHLEPDGDALGEGESSQRGKRKGKGKGKGRVLDKSACVVCHEEKHFFDIMTAPCGHDYCRACIAELFQLATTDESLFPPRCCRQEIELDLAYQFLNTELSTRFAEKAKEFRTLNRTYCVASACSKFLLPTEIEGDVATCPACLERTCTVCKSAAHDGDCPNDTALQQVIQAATDMGWQRCYSCRRMVELAHGCNHMTCLCRAEFCYVCALVWKSCACATWTEERLYNRAVQVAARREIQEPEIPEPVAEAPAPPPEPAPLQPRLLRRVLPLMQPNVLPVPDYNLGELPLVEAPPEQAPPPPIQAQFALRPLRQVVTPPPEAALLVEEVPLVNQFPSRPPSPEPAFEIPNGLASNILQIMNSLRENHVCTHERWQYIAGPHQCEECFHNLPQYIFECRQCNILACWRCRRNRL